MPLAPLSGRLARSLQPQKHEREASDDLVITLRLLSLALTVLAEVSERRRDAETRRSRLGESG